MLQHCVDTPKGVQALDAVGVVTKRDYEDVVVPLVDQAWRAGARLRLLYQCGPRFRWLTPGALWADARLGTRYLRLLDGCAVVSDTGWIRHSTRGISTWMPCPVRVFGNDDHGAALTWLDSLPERNGVSPRAMISAYLGGCAGAIGGLVTRPARTRR